ncbi:putative Ig domain-containing protein [Methylomonas paludis]|uniref:Ig domain-containing protein n=1 Tax=Methylomonas paludis TaxID=1173101 RepID=A0A975MQ93_9GAMM|nr:Ig domain-containing protein [Methylomonas paludis]QWF72007.1 putative Ig domain-containing protein [Methylomonas paludis]
MNKIRLLSNNKLRILTAFVTVICLSGFLAQGYANPRPIYESRYDHYRTGANLQETILNTSNVNHADFGLLFTMPVNGLVFAQPLYVPNLTVNHYVHNVIFTVSSGGGIYAYDADSSGPPLWFRSLNTETKQDRYPNWVIFSVPVIDPNTNTMYVVANNFSTLKREAALYAIDISTGQDKFGSPVTLTGSYTAAGKTVNFVPTNLNQRAGLALANGQIIIAFSLLNEDSGGGNGFVMSYDARTLKQTGAFAPIVTASRGGGIWQSGRAPMVDDNGFVYLFVGNSWSSKTNNAYDGISNFTESLLKFDTHQHLKLVDWFTPANWLHLDKWDMDMASSGPLLIPGTSLVAGGGKYGNYYLWHKDNLGKLVKNDKQVVQVFNTGKGGTGQTRAIFSGLVYWQRSAAQGGSLLFDMPTNSTAKAYAFDGQTINPRAVSLSSAVSDAIVGGALSLSANGGQSGTGIVWAASRISASNNQGVIRALDAENLKNELWSSQHYLSDKFGNYDVWNIPVVTNGKVYAPTLSRQITVYGLFASQDNPPPSLLVPGKQTTVVGTPVNLSLSARDAQGDTLSFSATNLPDGLSINPKTGLIAGTPTTAETQTVNLSVSDNFNPPRIAHFVWLITAP